MELFEWTPKDLAAYVNTTLYEMNCFISGKIIPDQDTARRMEKKLGIDNIYINRWKTDLPESSGFYLTRRGRLYFNSKNKKWTKSNGSKTKKSYNVHEWMEFR